MSYLEDCWCEREEIIHPLSTEPFNRLNATDMDPRWLAYGVFLSLPTANRVSWIYAASDCHS